MPRSNRQCDSCKRFERWVWEQSSHVLSSFSGTTSLSPTTHTIASSFIDIQQSASNGCPCCKFWLQALWTAIQSRNAGRRNEHVKAHSISRDNGRWPAAGVLMNVSCAEFSAQVRLRQGSLLARALDALDDVPEERVVSGTGTRIDGLQTFCQWLSRCDCAAKVNFDGRPSRLLLLGSDSLSLVQTVAVRSTPQYVALSFSWGVTGHRLVLTNATKASIERGVPYSSLPKTIGEAARLVYNLGIPYLWVDALCIMQDGDEWSYEAKRMHEVYGHAVFTLAPASAEHSDAGMKFVRPGSDAKRSAKIKFAQLVATIGSTETPTSSVITVLEQSPLADRGWIFQEELLSPRLVYWSDEGLDWSCLKGQETAGNVTLEPDDARNLSLQHQGFWSRSDPQRLWPNMIMHYSRRSFTRPSDRMPALKGVADIIRDLVHDEYFSGNWKRQFPHFLSWTVVRDNERGEEPLPGETLAPSWSWTSIPQSRQIWMDNQSQQGTAVFHGAIGES